MTLFKKLNAIRHKPSVSRMVSWVVPFRFPIVVCIHIVLFMASYLLAFYFLNSDTVEIGLTDLPWQTLIPFVLIRLGVFWYHDLYQGLWRYVSFEDLINIIRATTISSLIFIVIGIFYMPLRIHQNLYVMEWVFCVMLSGGIRFSVREFREKYLPACSLDRKIPILVVGPLTRVYPLLKEFLTDPYSSYLPCGILDPTKKIDLSVRRIFDLPVWSMDQIISGKMFKTNHVSAVVLCWPEASKKEIDHVVELLQPLEAPFKTIPRMEDILSDRVKISDIRDVEIEDLLDRPAVQIEMTLIKKHLTGKTILVSGGGGSIGSELCRQISAFEPSCLVIAERSENSLYELEIELRKSFPSLPLVATISSVNDYKGMKILMEKTGVDLVFHAAAYKHVPIMETVPVESAYNNILGTYNLARAAIDTGVKRFVMISTDKAVNPTNVMGVTKRIAEMVVQSLNSSIGTRFMIVRFGNVLGSAGSVVPLFKKQIREGGPVTVTHPDIERFFMTIPEAVQLILQAGSIGHGGEIFVLEMGKAVKILNLAEKLISLSGKRPRKDIDIKFTGLRPGEKMYEELFNCEEEELPTAHPRIRVACSEPVDVHYMAEQIAKIRHLVKEREEEALFEKFRELVPRYKNGRKESEPLVHGRPGKVIRLG